MDLQFINWKMHLDSSSTPEPDEYFKEFNGWIPDSPEVFLDVADYKHVQDGPITLLVGHYVNYSLDQSNRKLGLLADFKHPMQGDNVAKMRETLRGLLQAAKRLSDATSFAHTPKFASGDLRFIVNSRGIAPNTAATFAAVKGELATVLDSVYGAGNYSLEHLTDSKQRFMVQVQAKNAPTLEAMLAKV